MRRAQLEERQFLGLTTLLQEVARSNRFYREFWKGCGVNPAITSLEDFRRRFPFTTKRQLGEDQAAHPPYGSNLTFPLERYTRCHGTSGSTGRPLRWLDTPESWAWMVGNWRRVYEAAGVGPGDRVFFAFSFGPFLGFWTAFEAALSLKCLCLPGGGMTTSARLQSLMEQQATVLCCTPTYAIHLAETAQREGIPIDQGRVRRIIVAGEPGGSIPSVRTRIESAWGGARVFDHHGMTEVGPVSYECPGQSSVLHVIEESYLAEVIDPATGEPVPPGESGELILTTLGRVGSPLIRYRTGDLVRARARSDSPCACGTEDLALEGGILGRVDDMVVIRGVNVFPSAVDEIVRSVGEIAEYRAEILESGTLLELQVTVEPQSGGIDSDRLARMLEGLFQTRLALRVPVRVAPVGSLPRFELKARRWVRSRAERLGSTG